MTDEPETQADKFRDMARELECDENAAKFEANVLQIVQATGGRASAAPTPEDKVRKVATAPKSDEEAE